MRDGTYFTPIAVNYIFSKRGLGDDICAIRVADRITEKWPHVEPILWLPDHAVPLAERLLLHNDAVGIRPWSKMDTDLNKSYPTKNFEKQHLNSHRVPLMAHNYLWMADYFPATKEDWNYPVIDLKGCDYNGDLPASYAVIIVTHNTPLKEFHRSHIEVIINYLASINMTAVLLGKTEDKLSEGRTHKYGTNIQPEEKIKGAINLVDKTSLIEAASIMSRAKVVIGIDGGLIHLAACTRTTIVSGFSIVKPSHFTPTRRGISGWRYHSVSPSDKLACRFCHSNVNFVDYDQEIQKECLYGDRLCLDQLTGDKFVKQLRRIL